MIFKISSLSVGEKKNDFVLVDESVQLRRGLNLANYYVTNFDTIYLSSCPSDIVKSQLIIRARWFAILD